jgi:7-carboxy-7-deazaguanine synthase
MALKETLKISEIFSSIQGESSKVGLPSTFIRLTGCPLRCQYCDTSYAFTGGERISFDEIFSQLKSIGYKDICVTGGEPLAQNETKDFLKKLVALKYHVSLETSGSISINNIDSRVKIVMDIKTPDSGEVSKNNWSNISLMKPTDEFKFVICSDEDYQWSKTILKKYTLHKKSSVLFSPCYDSIKASHLANLILKDRLKVRFQMQLHKILWGNEPGR